MITLTDQFRTWAETVPRFSKWWIPDELFWKLAEDMEKNAQYCMNSGAPLNAILFKTIVLRPKSHRPQHG